MTTIELCLSSRERAYRFVRDLAGSDPIEEDEDNGSVRCKFCTAKARTTRTIIHAPVCIWTHAVEIAEALKLEGVEQ